MEKTKSVDQVASRRAEEVLRTIRERPAIFAKGGSDAAGRVKAGQNVLANARATDGLGLRVEEDGLDRPRPCLNARADRRRGPVR